MGEKQREKRLGCVAWIGGGGHTCAMPVDAKLTWEGEALTAALGRLPSLKRALRAATRLPGPRSLDVSALVLEDVGHGPRDLDPADAAVLLGDGDTGAVLGWEDLPEGLGGGFAWTPRWPALRWLARLARERKGEMDLRVCHERGDQLYELVLWRFGAAESLHVEDYDGGEHPRRRGSAHRNPPPPLEPAFGQLAEALARARDLPPAGRADPPPGPRRSR